MLLREGRVVKPNLVRNVTVTRTGERDFSRYMDCETIRVDLDMSPRATYAVSCMSSDTFRLRGGREAVDIERRITEDNGRRIAYEVAAQVRNEIEESVLRLLGFLKPGEKGSLGKA